MEKDGTHGKRVLTAFLLQVREISYKCQEFHFCLPLEARQMKDATCTTFDERIDKSCFLVVQVVLVGTDPK